VLHINTQDGALVLRVVSAGAKTYSFPPIFPKIGEVQPKLDFSENPISSRVWVTHGYIKKFKEAELFIRI
jgi:hypothetical protein